MSSAWWGAASVASICCPGHLLAPASAWHAAVSSCFHCPPTFSWNRADTVKVRLQTQPTANPIYSEWAACWVLPRQPAGRALQGGRPARDAGLPFMVGDRCSARPRACLPTTPALLQAARSTACARRCSGRAWVASTRASPRPWQARCGAGCGGGTLRWLAARSSGAMQALHALLAHTPPAPDPSSLPGPLPRHWCLEL